MILPHKFQDAEKFNLQFSDFSEITETADKLRWLRYQKGLRQRDVADYAGIYRSTYIHYEEYGKDFYSPKHMEKIAQLFEVPVERLLDDYNLFLRNGQGKQIKAIRMKLGLTQREYADRLGISLCNLKQWEQNRKQLFKSTWEKYFHSGFHPERSLIPVRRKFCGRFFSIILSLPGKNSGSAKSSIICQRFTLLRA